MSDFIKDSEVKSLTEELIKSFPEKLKHIDISRILFIREISAGQRSDHGTLVWIYPPYSLLNPDIRYMVQINWKSDWDTLNKAQKVAIIMHQLLHIPEDFVSGPLKHNVVDFSLLVDALGTNWATNPRIPDLTEIDEPIIVADSSIGV